MKRVLTAAALIPIIVYTVLFANFWIFLGVLVAVAVLCYYEYDSVAAEYGFGRPGPLGYGVGLLVMVWERDAWLLMVGFLLIALAMALRDADLGKSLPRVALLVAGVLYVFGCWRFAVPLREISPHWLMYSLLLNWAGDTGAYYVGRQFGRHKLAPQVSPNKSWEGSAASVVLSVIVGAAYLRFFIPSVQLWQAVVLTAIANTAGQFGDLAESAMKRGSGVKDSSSILPGHGGFLDRVDSTLFTLPVVFAWVKMAG
jgi:phosphatidate cytidylyltransferase